MDDSETFLEAVLRFYDGHSSLNPLIVGHLITQPANLKNLIQLGLLSNRVEELLQRIVDWFNNSEQRESTPFSDLWDRPDNRIAFESSLSPGQLVCNRIFEWWFLTQQVDSVFRVRAMLAIFVDETDSRSRGRVSLLHRQFAQLFLSELVTHPPSSYRVREHLCCIVLTGMKCLVTARQYYLDICRHIGTEQAFPSFPDRDIHFTRSAACPWLKSQETIFWPEFLWNVKKKCSERMTNIVQELGGNPKYLAVSHTWGRWKKKCDPLVRLPGVCWGIPQNSRFVVANLPQILEATGFDYVWLDLLCIPQDDSDLSEELKQIQRQEISRQASIFFNATMVRAWFNDVKGWTGIETTLQWLYLRLLQVTGIEKHDGYILEHMSLLEHSGGQLELFNSSSDLNPWFTSLWTLQELCLRPDVSFGDVDWSILSVSDTAVSLFDLVSLGMLLLSEQTIRLTNSVRQLYKFLELTGISGWREFTQTQILSIGDRRHCRSRRAEAIMSAVGATEWFRMEDTRVQLLILNTYPLPFINEVRRKVGSALFFMSEPYRDKGNASILSAETQGLDKMLTRMGDDVLGTMLPFGVGGDTGDTRHNEMTPHPTLNTWQIQLSGSVRITQACVVSSASLESICDTRFGADGYIHNAASSGERAIDVEADKWVSTYMPEMPNYLVCALYTIDMIRGIVLKEIRPGILIKLGIFQGRRVVSYINAQKEVNSRIRDVDWLVL